jgi:long-chain-fatty-acid--CoA ligase ACSBG
MEHANTRVLSYLPLSHVAAQMVDIVAMMAVAGTTYFADKNVLKSSLLDNLQWCKPTVFFAVPRVWEKIMEKMMEKAKDVKGLKKTVSRKAKEIGLKYHTKGTNATEFKLFQKIYYSKVKALLGLDQCMAFMSGAAPIDRKTQNYFLSLDIMILELYGMSETTGGHTFNTVSKFKMSSVGAPLAECYKSKLMRPTNDEVTEEKELLMWGRHIMMGYAGRQDATRKDMTEDGWLRSGDLVSIDNEGFHAIVGREKDLIITAGGENIAPQPIHDLVKEQLPIISQVLLLGDKQKFVSCFLTLAVEVDPETMEPTGKLSSAARDWVQAQGSNATTVQEVLEGPDVAVMRGIQAGIDKANKEAVSNAQRIQKWMVIPRDFSLPGGELGPTMKVKRQAVTKKYEGCIERIYNIA